MTVRLAVSANRRFLQHADGRPFFYLGDTAWELLHRCDREETEVYLQDRRSKGFTVVQTVALTEADGLRTPNAYGDRPLVDEDPCRPNESYWRHVDWTVERANALGLHVGLLPTWGEWHCSWHGNREIFTTDNARRYGEWLGQRYRDADVIWILGGDRPIVSEPHLAIIRAMAEGLCAGDGGRHLRTYHPAGGMSSSQFVHAEPWLDFHMVQSGHRRDRDNYAMIERDYSLLPRRPCMDAEPGYEDHPNGFDPAQGWLDEHDVRKSCYWSLFAGAHGYTYGCHDVWQMWQSEREPFSWARTPWKEALHLPGAGQLIHARRLIESRPFFSRIPDQKLVPLQLGGAGDHVRATRCEDGRYAFIYIPSGQRVTLDLTPIRGEQLRATWFNPRDGSTQPAGTVAREPRTVFQPPFGRGGRDWVLVIDGESQGFSSPGGDIT
jgi:hypothetical protein